MSKTFYVIGEADDMALDELVELLTGHYQYPIKKQDVGFYSTTPHRPGISQSQYHPLR